MSVTAQHEISHGNGDPDRLPDIRRHREDGRWIICWEADRQHWRVFETGTFTGSIFGDLNDPHHRWWRPMAIVDLPEQTDDPVKLPSLMDGVVHIDIKQGWGIGLGIVYYDSDGGSTRLSIGQARAVAAQLLAAADAYQQSGW